MNSKLENVYEAKKKIQTEYDKLSAEKKKYEDDQKAEAFADAEQLAFTRKNEIKNAGLRLAKA